MKKSKGKKAGMDNISVDARNVIHAFSMDGIDINQHKDITGIIVESTDEENEICDVIGFTSKKNTGLRIGDFFPHPDEEVGYYYEIIDYPSYGMYYKGQKKRLSDLCDELMLNDMNDYLARLDILIENGIVRCDKEIYVMYVIKYTEDEVEQMTAEMDGEENEHK